MKCAAVICAAGAGSRMGQNKALCHIGTRTFLDFIVRTLLDVTTEIKPIVVVTGAEAEAVRRIHADLPVVWAHNDAWRTTYMLESLVCGLACVPDECDVIHWPVDCIGVSAGDIARLLEVPREFVSVLGVGGIPGHPVRFTAEMLHELRTPGNGFRSLRDFFSLYPCKVVESSEPVLMNCNDPQSLADFIARRAKL